MNEQENIDIVIDEITNFVTGYFMALLMTNETLKFKKENNTFQIGKYLDRQSYYQNGSEPYFSSTHKISKISRTKIKFSFAFLKNDIGFAVELMDILNGFVDYKFYSGFAYDNCEFTMDFGLKKNSEKFFGKLNF